MKKRAFKVSIVLILTAALALYIYIHRDKKPVISVEYAVCEGDTLWEIAENTYGKNADIHKAVREIRKINNCTGEIYPGDILRLPKR